MIQCLQRASRSDYDLDLCATSRGEFLPPTAALDHAGGLPVSSAPVLRAIRTFSGNRREVNHRHRALRIEHSPKELVMKWLTLSFGLVIVTCGCGCWRPYYGRNYAPPATAPAFAPATYQQPVVQQAPMVAQPQVIQAAPMVQQQCVPCQPQPVCVPCY